MRELPTGQRVSLDDREQWIRLDWNEACEPPIVPVMNAIAGILHRVHEYPPADCSEVEGLIAEWHGVKPENVVLTAGADHALALAIQALPQNSRIGMTIPNYGYVEGHALANRHAVHRVKSTTPDRDVLSNLAKECDCVYVSNPMAQVGLSYARDALLNRVTAHWPAQWIVDETYAEYALSDPSILPAMPENSVIVRSLSKAFGLAGLRVGYCVGRGRSIERIRDLRPLECVNIVGYVASRAAIQNRNEALATLQLVKARRAYVASRLQAMDLVAYDCDANFITVHLDEERAETLRLWLEEQRILVRHIPDWPGVLRVGIGSDQAMSSFLQAVEVWALANRYSCEGPQS